ncbi:branched-chain amino acid transport system II carrier protein [Hutsoniella sourekii]|uniref:branched-chain amino acid transport system II carrier protein n=1 Tax=Hutsoniella sourekii TaxID=87650 RepID=UPI0004B422F9|nr:branched-chain amino acid transport system II carrier protein [Hutsoniella sourekii]
MLKSPRWKDTVVVGFTLFATFFGAGNLVFPPYMGVQVGDQWLWTSLGLFITGIIICILSMVAIVKGGGSIKRVTQAIHPNFYKWFNGLTMYLIALLILIPRTGATTHEVGVRFLWPQVPTWLTLIIFFTIVFFLTVDKQGVVDKIGGILTPVLIIIVGIILVKGVSQPISDQMMYQPVDYPFQWGFVEGYQMGDLITGLLFSSIMIQTIQQKGYTPKAGLRLTYQASMIATILLMVIYGGLLYIGATASTIYPPDIERTQLLSLLVNQLLGKYGQFGLSLAVTLACLTTATGLLTSVCDFTVELLDHKVKYQRIVLLACIFCVIQGSIGVEAIIHFSSPLFALAYPLGILITIMGLWGPYLINDGVCKGAVVSTFIFTCFQAVYQFLPKDQLLTTYLSRLPFIESNFAWLVFALLGGLVGGVCWSLRWGKQQGYIQLMRQEEI